MRLSLSSLLVLFSFFIFGGCDSQPKDPGVLADYGVVVNFSGTTPDPKYVYAMWIENERGENVQSLYVCNTLNPEVLTGTPIPYWARKTDTGSAEVDAVTDASTQGSLIVTRDSSLHDKTQYRICFEIDRSNNSNNYFTDRPSFIYKTDLIDLQNIQSPYTLNLVGWMSNETVTGGYSQKPTSTISGWSSFQYMNDIGYIVDSDGDYNDMVNSLSATITKK